MPAVPHKSSTRDVPESLGVPRHVAIIMDGNGRWAKRRLLPRVAGHRKGVETVRAVIRAAMERGVEYLTLFAFSSENWKRPRPEVGRLWRLLRANLIREDGLLVKNGLRLRVIGRREGIPAAALREVERVEALTERNGRMTVVLALNYGGRAEIVDAARSLLAEGRVSAAKLDEKAFAARLTTAGLPDPDLLIRTSGEMRISNFLLWQIAYAEIVVTPVLWPDFRRRHLIEAILEYQGRERRFGDVRPSALNPSRRT